MKTLKKKLTVISDKLDEKKTKEQTLLQKMDWQDYGLENPYNVVREFIKEKGLKLYGGQALHEHLNKFKKGFYETWEFPDYDVYSPDAWNHAQELTERLYKKGYLFAEARSSILNDEHHQTYKVGVDMIPMLDLTQVGCPSDSLNKNQCKNCGVKNKKGECISIFNNIPAVDIKDPKGTLVKNTYDYKKGSSLYPKKFFVSSPEWLKTNMYRELTEPLSNPPRLPKVGTRLELFNKYYETKFRKCSDTKYKSIVDIKVKNILNYIGNYIKNKNLINFGLSAHNFFTKNVKSKGKLYISDYKVYTLNGLSADKLLNNLKTKFRNETFKLYTRRLYWKEHYDIEYIISIKKKNKFNNLITFIASNECIPYIKYNGIRYATIDRLKYLYYMGKELPDIFKLTEENPLDYECLLKELILAEKTHKKKNKGKKMTKFRRYVGNCQGEEIDKRMVHLQERWFEKLKTLKHTKFYLNKPKKGYLTKIYPLPKEEMYLPFKPEERVHKKYFK